MANDNNTPPVVEKYWHSMDNNYFKRQDITTKGLGVSTPPMQDQLQSIRARIMQGANAVELGFWGVQKGSASGGNYTPGTVGIPEREAIKEIAKINDVNLASVHTAMKVQGLAGFDGRQFSEQKRSQDMEEVKRTIDFAGDVTGGGAVVVHTGEFPYSIKEKYGKFKLPSGKEIEMSEGHSLSEKAPFWLVDKYDGNVTRGVQKDIKVYSPELVWEDEAKGIVKLDKAGRAETKTVQRKYDSFEEEAKKNVEDKKLKEKNIADYKRFMKEDMSEELYEQTYGNPAWLINKTELDNQGYESRARMIGHKMHIGQYQQQIDSADKQISSIKSVLERARDPSTLPAGFDRETLKKLEHDKKRLSDQLEIERQHALAFETALDQYSRRAFNAVPIEYYGKQKTAESMGELAIEAARVTKSKKLENPIFVAPENLWGDLYGAHPQDLKNIVTDARSKMVDFMTKDEVEINGEMRKNPYLKDAQKTFGKNISDSRAKKIAEDHVKATFDIAHANIWRKYFKGSDKQFKEWMGSEVDKLTKDGIIGHVHVSDNFGYNDEHLPPGYGNAPIKEFLTHMKKSGFKKEFIVEPAHHDIESLQYGFRHLETPVYRIANQTHTWTDVHGSYFGQSFIPGYVTPGYLPIPQGGRQPQPFTWSELPLE